MPRISEDFNGVRMGDERIIVLNGSLVLWGLAAIRCDDAVTVIVTVKIILCVLYTVMVIDPWWWSC